MPIGQSMWGGAITGVAWIETKVQRGEERMGAGKKRRIALNVAAA